MLLKVERREGKLIFSTRKLHKVRKQLFSQFLIATSVAELVLLSCMSSANVNGAIAQIVPSQSVPLTSFGNISGAPTIQITSHEDGQQVPTGELTIRGISSDENEKNCQVYADVNDNTPMQNVTAAGDTRDPDDFSKWSFIYTDQYQLIGEGENELTAKISCFGLANSNSGPLSEWYTVNVTGIQGTSEIVIVPVTPPSIPAFSAGDEAGEQEEDGDEDNEDIGSSDEDN